MGQSATPLRAVVGWSWRGRYVGDKIVVWRLDCGHTVELPSNRGGRKRCRCPECAPPEPPVGAGNEPTARQPLRGLSKDWDANKTGSGLDGTPPASEARPDLIHRGRSV